MEFLLASSVTATDSKHSEQKHECAEIKKMNIEYSIFNIQYLVSTLPDGLVSALKTQMVASVVDSFRGFLSNPCNTLRKISEFAAELCKSNRCIGSINCHNGVRLPDWSRAERRGVEQQLMSESWSMLETLKP